MNIKQKLEILDKARGEISSLEQKKIDIFEKACKEAGLGKRYERSLWDFLLLGLRFARHEIEVALKTNEGKDV